jgi:hypothetical protein
MRLALAIFCVHLKQQTGLVVEQKFQRLTTTVAFVGRKKIAPERFSAPTLVVNSVLRL